MEETKILEKNVIDQLRNYKRMAGRIRALERYPIGNGMYLNSYHDDDKLQDLHRLLKGMPTYMYLTKREQALETTAHAYMVKYPLGTRSQLWEIKSKRGVDEGDSILLKELEHKIEKVLDARRGNADGYDAVLKRVSELQDLQSQKEQVDEALETFEGYNPHYAKLLKLRYIEKYSIEQVLTELSISRRVFFRWRVSAIEDFTDLMGKVKSWH